MSEDSRRTEDSIPNPGVEHLVYETPWIDFFYDDIVHPDGTPGKYAWVRNHSDVGGVMIIPDLPFDAETWIGLRLTISASAIDRGQPLLALSINGLSIDGAPLQLTETLPNYPGLAPSAFEAIAPSDEVKRYFSELEVARLKIKARESARRKEWSVVEELVGVMERLDIGDWAKDGVQEIKTLMAERDVELFSKEAMISSMKSRSQHKTGLVDYTNDPLADAQERDSQERSKVSFLQRKVRQGRRRDTGS